ncbi:MAG: UDP-N-acetyl-D-glucosamine 6-dehydrogenase [Candidatus Accumulibacter adjunctus]|uniref:UDP-N-acetyl-D-glucosamine 6-dehydrogenase n=1 Tax=Candidatus Accumulibacter adjunctus TaxID=1454001 RepID=A0A011N146_9PROT|nr:MAG: UDP-N-acetyl-D-glucosamine 6-dehydrogenase [Candidatus Accumulibacter adjunctus]
MFNTPSMIGLDYMRLRTATLSGSREKLLGRYAKQYAATAGYLRVLKDRQPTENVPTAMPRPFTNGHELDFAHIQATGKSIAPVLANRNLVIAESTLPIPTTPEFADWPPQARPRVSLPEQTAESADIHKAYFPERLLPSSSVHELAANDLVICSMTRTATYMATPLAKTVVERDLVPTNAPTAEMRKRAETRFRDVKIGSANELSIICDKMDINVWEHRGE